MRILIQNDEWRVVERDDGSTVVEQAWVHPNSCNLHWLRAQDDDYKTALLSLARERGENQLRAEPLPRDVKIELIQIIDAHEGTIQDNRKAKPPLPRDVKIGGAGWCAALTIDQLVERDRVGMDTITSLNRTINVKDRSLADARSKLTKIAETRNHLRALWREWINP